MLARYGAPALFLAAATAAVLLVRAGLNRTHPAQASQPVASATSRPSSPAKPVREQFYVIRAGDTLGDVAQRFGTTVEALLVLNPGIEPTSLRIGQRIRTT
jgi:LysM repeat protein